jgi:hypothetical protein
MKKSKMSAVTLRRILASSIVLLIGLAGVGFYFAQSFLHDFAVSVGQTVAQSKSSDTSLQSLSTLQQKLANEQDIIRKTNTIFTSTTNYQTQAVQDLITYAGETGITISNYVFPATGVTSSAATNSIPLTQITVTLASPVSYNNLLKFMTAIEGNLPKMQITSLNLGRVDGDSTSVQIQQLTVAVYTR